MLYSNKKDIDGIPCYLESHFEKKRSSFIKHVQRNTLEQRNLQQRKSRSTHCPMSNMTTEERIHLYQQKYIHIIAAETQLRTWIKSSKQKGPPLPLLKPHRSKSSFLTYNRSKGKSLLLHMNQELSIISPKSSFSTFLKKAMRPSESFSNKDQHARRSNFLHQPSKSTPKNSRFSLVGSLNRLPLSKHFHHTSTAHHLTDDHIHPKKPYLNHTGYVKRKKIPQSYLDYARQNEIPILSEKKSVRSQSSTIQHQPSSIFLDRLQHSNTFEKIKDQHIQSNACDKSTVHASNTANATINDRRHHVSHNGSLPLSFQRCYNDVYEKKEEKAGFDQISGSMEKNKSSENTLRRKRALQNIAERYKSTFNHQTSEQRKHVTFSITPSFSTLRFSTQKLYSSKRRSVLS